MPTSTPTPDAGTPAPTDGTTPGDSTQAPPVDPADLTPETWGAIIAVLGLDDTATSDDVLAAVTDLATAEAAGAGAPSAIVAAARKRGLTVLDADQVAKLRRDALEGQKIQAKANTDRREGLVAAAINRGAITPGRRKHWLALLEADPGMEQILASTPAETAVPLTEIGHSVDLDHSQMTGGDPDAGRWVR
ncbi:hypothetical protein FK268_22930 [Tsukamurella sputi]|uniref:Uncharacterized protein n=1 Tax=Tsukamurella sputi TaxID=2591848 RepID=A0A5C5RGP0_9ACTN|nr:phage protease [Tsukamurella sputi]TWS21784.1 hypothetical protein FK268_22930 [Tsukamurella sputi]